MAAIYHSELAFCPGNRRLALDLVSGTLVHVWLFGLVALSAQPLAEAWIAVKLFILWKIDKKLCPYISVYNFIDVLPSTKFHLLKFLGSPIISPAFEEQSRSKTLVPAFQVDRNKQFSQASCQIAL